MAARDDLLAQLNALPFVTRSRYAELIPEDQAKFDRPAKMLKVLLTDEEQGPRITMGVPEYVIDDPEAHAPVVANIQDRYDRGDIRNG